MSQQAIISKIYQSLRPKLRKEILHRDIDTMEKLKKSLQQIQKNYQRFQEDNTDIINEIKALRDEIIKVNKESKTSPQQTLESINYIPKNTQPTQSYPGNQQNYPYQYQTITQRPDKNQYYNAQPGPMPGPQMYPQTTTGIFCSFCNLYSHATRDCRKKRRASICYFCGQSGHYARECRHKPPPNKPHHTYPHNEEEGHLKTKAEEITKTP